MASKESRLQPSQSGLGVPSQQNLCCRSAPSCYNNHTATVTSWCGQPVVQHFWLPTCKWIQHSNSTTYDSTQHLSLCNITVDSRQSPHLLQVTIKQSKTDSFIKELTYSLVKQAQEYTLWIAMIPYLIMQGAQVGPLFITKDWKQLTQKLFSSNLNTILQKIKMNASHYNTQFSHRSHHISKGGWNLWCPHSGVGKMETHAYLMYIRTPRSQLATLSKQLVQGHPVQQLDWLT